MNKSYMTAFGLLALSILWMLSGILSSRSELPAETEATTTQEAVFHVETRMSRARPVTAYIIAQGSLEPNRTVSLRAETAGQVESILTAQGGRLASGDAILRLRMDERELQREQAALRVEERQRRYQAVRNLQERDLASRSELDTALADLRMAEVELARVELDIEKTVIRAPFAGILDENLVEIGDFINRGDEVALIVDNDPLLVTASIPQRHVHFLREDENVRITLIDGKELQGHIRYISARADAGSRTFRVEIEIPNPEAMRAGSSATAYIPREEIQAHFISAALLSLSDDGEMGVKAVSDEGLVSFHPVSIEFSEVDGMWVSGLPREIRLIVTGQGFAQAGEYVQFTELAALPEQAAPGPDSIPQGR